MENPKVELDQGKIVTTADQNAGAGAKPESEPQNRGATSGEAESGHAADGKEAHAAEKGVSLSPEVAAGSRSADGGVGSGGSNSYVAPAPATPPAESSQFSIKDAMFTVKNVLGRWAKNVSKASRKAVLNTWQHLKTSPSFAGAAVGRIARGTKVSAEGGYEKIFHQTFETEPDEKFVNSFVCYLSTSAGPVMGVVYVSMEKLAFCSDSPIPYKTDGRTEYRLLQGTCPEDVVNEVRTNSI